MNRVLKGIDNFMEQKFYRIGIDLGGTNIKAGIVDDDQQLIATASNPTKADRPWQEIVADMAETVRQAAAKADISVEACRSVGIGNPGVIDSENGIIVYSNNISWKNIPLAQEFRKHIDLPVHVSNDANCAAMGEVVAGAARGCKNVILLTLGTGVGGGIIINGQVYEGGIGGAELGHATLIAGGKLCTCGRRGCIESYCSATALIREADEALAKHPESMMAAMKVQAGGMNGKIPFDAAQSGDETAGAVVSQYIEWLAEAVTNYVNIFRPEVVLLSGGVCAQGENLTKPLNEYIRKFAFGGAQTVNTTVKIAQLGNNAGIIGAANFWK